MSNMANSRVPKFGDWGSAAEAGYTVCFDQARKGRVVAPMTTPMKGGPNESGGERNPNPGKSSSPSRARGGEREGRDGQGAPRTRDEKTPTKAEIGSGGGEVRRFNNFSPVNPNIVGGGADRHRPSAGTGIGPQEQGQKTAHSYSPHSPHHDKVNVRAGANQKSHGVGGRTNDKYSGRAARRPGTGGAAVPKFGDWNMNARAGAGDGGYTVIFNQARAEKHKAQSPADNLASAAVHPDSLQNKSPVPGNRHRGCCLPWGRGHHYP